MKTFILLGGNGSRARTQEWDSNLPYPKTLEVNGKILKDTSSEDIFKTPLYIQILNLINQGLSDITLLTNESLGELFSEHVEKINSVLNLPNQISVEVVEQPDPWEWDIISFFNKRITCEEDRVIVFGDTVPVLMPKEGNEPILSDIFTNETRITQVQYHVLNHTSDLDRNAYNTIGMVFLPVEPTQVGWENHSSPAFCINLNERSDHKRFHKVLNDLCGQYYRGVEYSKGWIQDTRTRLECNQGTIESA